jgi:hypothetical protein
MTADDDVALARLLDRHIADVLTWLDDYPEDQVDKSAVASFRRSMDWIIEQLPAQPRGRLAYSIAHEAALTTVIGLLVDLVWWLDSCPDEEVDEWAVRNLLESTAAFVTELPDPQRQRLLVALDELAVSEQHDGRRYQVRFFPFAMGLLDTEPGEPEPLVKDWVSPEYRAAGRTAAG